MQSLQRALGQPLRVFRNLPIAWKLGLMLVSGLAMLTGVSWFALDRLIVVGGLQDSVAAQAALSRQMQQGLLAAMELRVVSRELPLQQTNSAVNRVAEGAEKSATAARESLEQARKAATAEADQKGLAQALAQLDATAAAVKHAAALRIEMLTVRQKRLFQNRSLFESATKTFAQELGNGGAMLGGADAVRSDGTQAIADHTSPVYQAFEIYRLATARLQTGAVMFMATGNGGAANEVRDSTAEADKAMAQILSGGTCQRL